MKGLIGASALLGSALAIPLLDHGKGSFEIRLKQRRLASDDSMTPEDRLERLIASHAHTRARYGASDEGIVKRASSGQTYLAGNQESYYGSIEVGTPSHTYEVVMDTGSSDLVLAAKGASNLCGGQCTTDAPLYDPSSSSSAVNTNDPVELQYGTASASGVVVADTVSFAGFTGFQKIASCNDVNNLTTSADQTGLLGLAWAPLAQTNSTPFVEALWRNGSLSEPLFAFAMGRTDPATVSSATAVVSGGVLTVGATNSSFYSGNINYVSLSDSGTYWDFPITDVGVGGRSVGASTQAAILDTGTNSIAVPSSVADAVYSQIPNSQEVPNSGGIFAYPCSSNVQMSLAIGGQTYDVSSNFFNTGIISSDGQYCAGAVTSLGSSSSRQPSTELWIIGTPFLMGYYNVYRFSPPAVGLATLVDTNNALEKTPIPSSSGTSSSSSSGSGGSSTSPGGSGSSGSGSGSSGSGSGSGSTSGSASLRTSVLSLATMLFTAIVAL